MSVRVVVTSKDSDGVSRVERDEPATAAISLTSVGGVEIAYPLQVRIPPSELGDGGDPPDGVGPMIPPRGSLNFFQLYFPPGYPPPRGEEELKVIIKEMQEKYPGMLPAMEPSKGPGMHQTPTLDLMTVSSGAPSSASMTAPPQSLDQVTVSSNAARRMRGQIRTTSPAPSLV